jgi:catechol-2,3-dioxygenase
MVSFYMSLLSATIIFQNDSMTFLRYDDEHHRIAILQTPNVNPLPENTLTAGLDHVAFTFATLTSLAQTYVSLKSATPEPIVPAWCVNHGPTTSMYYRDPNGARVELQVDNFDTAEEANAFMRSAAFANNFVGTDFEPEEWAALILSKVGPDGEEGLGPEEVKRLKMRREIGGRNLPRSYQ